MARRVFFSFHFHGDCWRTNQVRNAGVVTGKPPVSPTRWEEIRLTGDRAIRGWIDPRIAWASCTIVLIGTHTAERPWVRYEIERSWEEKKALLGIRVHHLLDEDQYSSKKGSDPFSRAFPKDPHKRKALMDGVTVVDPTGRNSKAVYGHIVNHIEGWVEDSLTLRDLRTGGQ